VASRHLRAVGGGGRLAPRFHEEPKDVPKQRRNGRKQHQRSGNVVAGWQLARSLIAAEEQLAAGNEPDFMRAKINTARFARTAGTLLKNGVPLLSAMSIAKNVLGNSALGEQVETATKDVKTGGGLAHALAAGKRFPRMALQMIAVGEETGQLDDMLLRAADTYDREVRTTIDRLMAAFVPVMTILLAGFIAVIVISMVTAILSLNELVG